MRSIMHHAQFYQSDPPFTFYVVDACGPEPCENGGTCVVQGNSYTCNCLQPYHGENCKAFRGCYSKYFKRGCYPDIDTFNTMLFDNTSVIKWDNGWNNFINDLVCRFVHFIDFPKL